MPIPKLLPYFAKRCRTVAINFSCPPFRAAFPSCVWLLPGCPVKHGNRCPWSWCLCIHGPAFPGLLWDARPGTGASWHADASGRGSAKTHGSLQDIQIPGDKIRLPHGPTGSCNRLRLAPSGSKIRASHTKMVCACLMRQHVDMLQ